MFFSTLLERDCRINVGEYCYDIGLGATPRVTNNSRSYLLLSLVLPPDQDNDGGTGPRPRRILPSQGQLIRHTCPGHSRSYQWR